MGALAIAFVGFCAFIDLYATQPLLPLFESLFHASKVEVGLTVSVSTSAVALSAPFIGVLADRTERKRVIVFAIFALAAPTLLAATSRGLPDLLLWRFLQGLVIPGISILAITYVTEEAGVASVGKVMASYVAGTVLGGFSGRIIVGLVAAQAGWRLAFVVLGLVNIAGGFATWLWLPVSRHFKPGRGGASNIHERRAVLRDRRLLATYAIGFGVLFSLVATFTYVTFYLHAPPFELSPTALSWIFVVFPIGALATPVAGHWIDRKGSRAVLILSLGVGLFGMALTLTHSLSLVIAGLILCCSSVFVCQSASISYLRVAAPASLRSLASGIYVTWYYVGGSLGGILPGLLWSQAGWPGCVALIITVQVVTIAIATALWDHG
jgi:YNFM family putative membrane transporter